MFLQLFQFTFGLDESLTEALTALDRILALLLLSFQILAHPLAKVLSLRPVERYLALQLRHQILSLHVRILLNLSKLLGPLFFPLYVAALQALVVGDDTCFGNQVSLQLCDNFFLFEIEAIFDQSLDWSRARWKFYRVLVLGQQGLLKYSIGAF